MELPIDCFYVLLYICCIVHTGWSQEPCEVQVVSTQVFTPINEWAFLNCTHTCTRPFWDSRLEKRNIQEGENWVSTEVLVNDWEISNISCTTDDKDVPKSTVTVTAYALPSKVTIDIEEELEEGQEHGVTCTIFDVAPLANLVVHVMREGKVIDVSTFKGDRRKGRQSLSETYDFTASRRDNLQDFYCQATLDLEGVEDNTVQSNRVNVKTFAKPDVPAISARPNKTVKEGESVTLTCRSEGFPEPEYTWITPTTHHLTYSQDQSELTITRATFEHRGSYMCVAKNKHGRVRGEEILDIISNPGAQPDVPSIEVSPGQTIKEGSSLNLTCDSLGFPEPEYIWTIPSNKHVSFSADRREIFIARATSAHNGTYECAAQNIHGKVKRQLAIKIIGQPNGAFHTRPTAILLAFALAFFPALL